MPEVGDKLHHDAFGECVFVGLDGTTWIIARSGSQARFRVPAALRHQYRPIEVGGPRAVTGSSVGPQRTLIPKMGLDGEVQRAKRVLDSLRNGLPPMHTDAQGFAVGFSEMQRAISQFLAEVRNVGGSAMVIRGEYGQGKTFALKAMEETALAAGYVTARTEIDATENQLDKPHHVYRDLLRNLRLPGRNGGGIETLAKKTTAEISRHVQNSTSPEYRSLHAVNWLQDEKHLDCYPLAWLVSDPCVAEKRELLGLLCCEPEVRLATARAAHAWDSMDCWPNFRSATQGAFASYLLSGLGRLCRIIGYKGLIILMDEMENWQHLNWVAQSRAGNLLGGLIWGATAPLGNRADHHRPQTIHHSPRCRGFPFTTQPRCHLGVAVTMTPRGAYGPEQMWAEYGPLTVTSLPHAAAEHVLELCKHVASHYCVAYRLNGVAPESLSEIQRDAVARWRAGGAFTIRHAVQHVLATFDAWRARSDGHS